MRDQTGWSVGLSAMVANGHLGVTLHDCPNHRPFFSKSSSNNFEGNVVERLFTHYLLALFPPCLDGLGEKHQNQQDPSFLGQRTKEQTRALWLPGPLQPLRGLRAGCWHRAAGEATGRDPAEGGPQRWLGAFLARLGLIPGRVTVIVVGRFASCVVVFWGLCVLWLAYTCSPLQLGAAPRVRVFRSLAFRVDQKVLHMG